MERITSLIFRIIFLACTIPQLAPTPASATVALTVVVDEVENDAGHVLVAVCTADTFLTPGCPYTGLARANQGAVAVEVAGVPPGVYAVQVFHDANDNLDLDRTFIGFPKEGLGFSNDAPMKFGPPRFEDAAIEVDQGAVTRLKMRYY